MKIEEITRPGMLALGAVGFAATALLAFAAGVAVARNPEVLRRTMRSVALGIEHATLMAAQASEHIGDLWAQAREEAVSSVDAADFERAAAGAAKTAPAPAAATATAAAVPTKAARKRAASARKPRKSTAAAAKVAGKNVAE